MNGTVLCKRANRETEKKEYGGLTLEVKTVDLYRIVELPVNGECPFRLGDVVVSSSTGTKLEKENGEVFYLFETSKLMGAVQENDLTERKTR